MESESQDDRRERLRIILAEKRQEILARLAYRQYGSLDLVPRPRGWRRTLRGLGDEARRRAREEGDGGAPF